MKRLTPPRKPYAPYKPQPPLQKIEQRISIGTLDFSDESEFSLQTFEEYIKEHAPNVDPASVKFSWEIDKEHSYYDEIIVTLKLKLYTTAMIDNPNYSKQYKAYQIQLEKYHHDYEKYKKDTAQYKIDEKKYKENLELWQVEHAKAILANHEKKKAKKKK